MRPAEPPATSLRRQAATEFTNHPDAEILTSFPGIGPLTGARLLGEIGDDRTRFADARGLKAYAVKHRSTHPAPPTNRPPVKFAIAITVPCPLVRTTLVDFSPPQRYAEPAVDAPLTRRHQTPEAGARQRDS